MGSQTVGHDWATFIHSLSTINLGSTANPVHAIYICWDFLNFCFTIMVKCKYVYLLFIYTYAISCDLWSVVSDSATPWTVVHQAPLSMGFSRQECRGGLPFPPPGDLPNPGWNVPLLHWQADSLPLCHSGSPYVYAKYSNIVLQVKSSMFLRLHYLWPLDRDVY